MHSAALSERLEALRGRYPGSQPELIAEVVRSVLTTMHGDLSLHEAGLLSEVEELGRTIAAAKIEIAALKVDDINVSHIPSATDELDAIVTHTAAATDSILEVCETLDNVSDALGKDQSSSLCGDAATKLQEATTRIYEACSFQDITGQRITKVVSTLKTIEAKVGSIIAAFGNRRDGVVPEPPPDEAPTLLNGPQLAANAMDQSDIDKLLASFD